MLRRAAFWEGACCRARTWSRTWPQQGGYVLEVPARPALPAPDPPSRRPTDPAQLGVDLAELISRADLPDWRSVCLPLASTCHALRALLLPRLLERRRDAFRDALLMAA